MTFVSDEQVQVAGASIAARLAAIGAAVDTGPDQRSVGSWQGAAAEAYFRHTVSIEEFIEKQVLLLEKPMLTQLAADDWPRRCERTTCSWPRP